MFDKIMQGALIFKAKITKDSVQELLLEATSEDNWQTPTTILHQIANAAYNYEQWQKISSFIWQKLKLKKWKKVLKTLNLIEFLLKNGPPSILSSFKYQVYVFKSFDSFVGYEQGIDRGEAIRSKAKTIVQLLNNEELLEEERIKAKNIRDRLSNAVGSQGYGGKSGSYGGTRYKNEGSSKYEGKSSSSSNDYYSSSNNNYNNYEEGISSINKYKKQTGKSLYTKDNNNNQQKKITVSETIEKTVESPTKKPFQKAPPKLQKPGQNKKKEIVVKQNTKIETNIKLKTEPIDIFQFDQKPPIKPTKIQKPLASEFFQTPVIPPVQQPPQYTYQPPNVQPQYQNIQPQYQPPNTLNQFNQFTLPTNNLNLNPNLNPNQFNPINNNNPINYNVANNQNLYGGIYPNNQVTNPINPTTHKTSNNNQYTYNAKTNNKPQMKQEQQFGGFESSNKQDIKWLSKQQTNLIDFSDFGKEVKQKKQQPPAKKEEDGILLGGDLDNLMGGNFNVNTNYNQNKSNFQPQSFNNYPNTSPNYQYGYQGYIPANQQQYMLNLQQQQQQQQRRF